MDTQERFSGTLHRPAMSEYNDKRQLLTPHTSIESATVQSIEKELLGYQLSTITLYTWFSKHIRQ